MTPTDRPDSGPALRPGLPVSAAALLALTAIGLGLVTAAPSAVGAQTAGTERPTAQSVLQRAAVAARSVPHVGEVTVVTFGDAGPVVVGVSVRVGADGGVELRRPDRYVLGGGRAVRARDTAGMVDADVAAGVPTVVPEAVLRRHEATVGDPTMLDTGPATPIELVGTDNPAAVETLYVDDASGLLVRRETRSPDGRLLRVVAFTELSTVATVTASISTAPTVDVVPARAVPSWAPPFLAGGFDLVGVAADGAVARYSDGLSVLSVYRERGMLDVAAMTGADVRLLAGRTVWTWDGSEPRVLVWTDGDDTWTAVSDAPVEMLEQPLTSLPGRTVGHDIGSKISRGLRTLWQSLFGR